MKMTILEFKDGSHAFICGDDRKNHFFIPVHDKIINIDCPGLGMTEREYRQLDCTYLQWHRRWAK